MKRFILFTFSILLTFSFAIAQDGINYQGAATDGNGDELINQSISIRASVLSGSASGNLEWEETHSATTDQFGLFNVVIGQGTNTTNGAIASFDDMDWGSGNHFLKIEMDATGGTNYSMIGTTQMMSVPYALYAKSAGIDSAAIAAMIGSSGGGMGGGCNVEYPDGFNNLEPVNLQLNVNETYTVPAGKNFYILKLGRTFNSSGVSMTIDNIDSYNLDNAESSAITYPIILTENEILGTSNTGYAYFNGFLVDKQTNIISHNLTSSYTVPSSKILVITDFHTEGTSASHYFIDGDFFGSSMSNDYQYLKQRKPIFASSNSVITATMSSGSGDSYIRGFLVDENYFANCGGGGGSSSSASAVDSAMVAGMIANSGGGGSFGEWEVIWEDSLFYTPAGGQIHSDTIIVESDGFLYIKTENYDLNLWYGDNNTYNESLSIDNAGGGQYGESAFIPVKEGWTFYLSTSNGNSTLETDIYLIALESGGGSSISGSGGSGFNWRFPDGLTGTPLTWHLPGNDYTVPAGKNLYITSFAGHNTGDYMLIDGIEIINDNDFEQIIIVGPGSVVSTNSSTSANWANFNGILVDANVTPIIWHLPGNDYTVPAGKNLYITSFAGYNSGNYMQIDGLEIINDNDFQKIIIVGPGSVVSTNSNTSSNWANFNGYLVDENYFSSSANNSSGSNPNTGSGTVSISTLGDTLYINGQAIIIEGISAQNISHMYGTINDIDGNTYQTVDFGYGVEWMTENLKTTRFANGDNISNIKYPGGSPSTANPDYGYLYFGSVITDSRNVCPAGWHISTVSDWDNLLSILGDFNISSSYYLAAGKKIKSTTLWSPSSGNGTNEVPLNITPAGFWSLNGSYFDWGSHSYHWTPDVSPQVNGPYFKGYQCIGNSDNVFKIDIHTNSAASVRCVKD